MPTTRFNHALHKACNGRGRSGPVSAEVRRNKPRTVLSLAPFYQLTIPGDALNHDSIRVEMEAPEDNHLKLIVNVEVDGQRVDEYNFSTPASLRVNYSMCKPARGDSLEIVQVDGSETVIDAFRSNDDRNSAIVVSDDIRHLSIFMLGFP